jgi:hypothetical protein
MSTYSKEPDLAEMAAELEVLRLRLQEYPATWLNEGMMGSAYRPQQLYGMSAPTYTPAPPQPSYGGSAPTYAPAPSKPPQPSYTSVAVAKPYVLNSVAVWIWAFAPLIYVGLPWYLCILANCIFCAIDEHGLKKAGYDSAGLYWWGFTLVPVYLWKRQKLVDGTIAPFVIWLVLFILTLGA